MINSRDVRVGNILSKKNDSSIRFKISSVTRKKVGSAGNYFRHPLVDGLLINKFLLKDMDFIEKNEPGKDISYIYYIDMKNYFAMVEVKSNPNSTWSVRILNSSFELIGFVKDISYIHELQNFAYDITKQSLMIDKLLITK